MKNKVFTKQNIRNFVIWLIIFALLILFYKFIGCPFKEFLGISCPGCGMTRALKALLRLDFGLAFEMHPLIFFMPAALIVWLIRKKIPPKIFEGLIITAAVVMFAVYFIRLFSGSSIVCIDIKDGMIYKFLFGAG